VATSSAARGRRDRRRRRHSGGSVSETAGEGALYPPLAPGRSGLRKTSFALIDQIRSVDKRRIERVFGKVTANEMAAIDEGLLLFLGLA
jgi:mRNA interferase MazF